MIWPLVDQPIVGPLPTAWTILAVVQRCECLESPESSGKRHLCTTCQILCERTKHKLNQVCLSRVDAKPNSHCAPKEGAPDSMSTSPLQSISPPPRHAHEWARNWPRWRTHESSRAKDDDRTSALALEIKANLDQKVQFLRNKEKLLARIWCEAGDQKERESRMILERIEHMAQHEIDHDLRLMVQQVSSAYEHLLLLAHWLDLSPRLCLFSGQPPWRFAFDSDISLVSPMVSR